jgi:hypothetical protein
VEGGARVITYNRRTFDVAQAVISGRTLQDVADEHRVTRQRVQQMLKKVLKGTAEFYERKKGYPAPELFTLGRTPYRRSPETTMKYVEEFRKTRMDALL